MYERIVAFIQIYPVSAFVIFENQLVVGHFLLLFMQLHLRIGIIWDCFLLLLDFLKIVQSLFVGSYIFDFGEGCCVLGLRLFLAVTLLVS